MSITIEVGRIIGEAHIRFVAAAETQTEAMTLAAFLATSQQAVIVHQAEATVSTEVQTTEKSVKKEPAAKKPSASATDSTPGSQPKPENVSNDGAETGTREFTFKDVQALVTKYAAPGVPDGRARVVAILQRHGLTKFVETQINTSDTIQKVGDMIVRTFEGDGSFDPREAA
jgi:hypothetical protein